MSTDVSFPPVRHAAPFALAALATGAFGIGLTEFVIMGLLPEVAASVSVTIPMAGLLITGYALGVTFGGPILTLLAGRLPRRKVLLVLMAVFTLGNALCAMSPSFAPLMAGRVVTGFAHGTFFGVGAVVAQSLVPPERKASAIALMFTGLTLATVLGLPFGTWLGQIHGWRATFWTVSAIGVIAFAAIAAAVPRGRGGVDGDGVANLRQIARKGPLIALFLTVLGYAGVFLVFTYIAPILTEVSGIAPSRVSLVLLLFGLGLVIGNMAGGRLADIRPAGAVSATLAALSVTLLVMWGAMGGAWLAPPLVLAFGATAFATVAPLQAFMLRQARGTGQALASTLNISAFNLGNALGAWAGGLALSAGLGLPSLFPLAALPAAVAAAIAFKSIKA